MIVADLLTGKRVSRPHIWGMDQILPPELNDLEFEALRQLAAIQPPVTFRRTFNPGSRISATRRKSLAALF
jgi:hypothetical protein